LVIVVRSWEYDLLPIVRRVISGGLDMWILLMRGEEEEEEEE